MHRRGWISLLGMLGTIGAGCAAPQPPGPSSELPVLSLRRLADGVWMHTTFRDLPGWGRFPAHGLVVIDGEHSVLVDSGWTDAETDRILDWARDELGHPVSSAVFTHAHDDKMGGVAAVRRRGIATFAHPLSNRWAPQRSLVPAEHDLLVGDQGDIPTIGPVALFYPGPGHTLDNLVAYVPRARILFGGCLIRPAAARSLGNTADGDIDRWPGSVRRVADRFPEAAVVVPSHGPPGDRGLLELTERLAREAARAAPPSP